MYKRQQGTGAAEEIARGIANLNQQGNIDILIVGRGGGSPEDLWPFNEEIVARAIYTSERPVIAAVGHEVDYTIADYVADYRAPTPSAAAEIVAREQGALLERVDELQQRLQTSMQQRLEYCQQRLETMRPPRLYQRLHQHLEQTSQYVDERRNALAIALDWYLRSRLDAYRTGVLRLEALSPLSSLARGFVACQHQEDGRLVRSSEELKIGEQVKLRFRCAGALCKVEGIIDE